MRERALLNRSTRASMPDSVAQFMFLRNRPLECIHPLSSLVTCFEEGQRGVLFREEGERDGNGVQLQRNRGAMPCRELENEFSQRGGGGA